MPFKHMTAESSSSKPKKIYIIVELVNDIHVHVSPKKKMHVIIVSFHINSNHSFINYI